VIENIQYGEKVMVLVIDDKLSESCKIYDPS